MSFAIENCEMAYLGPRFLSEFFRESGELEDGLTTLVVVTFDDAHSVHLIRVHSKEKGYVGAI